jgi:hypothetical protein
MSWAKIDDRFHSHPKALRCSLGALGAFVVSLSWVGSHETDGRLPMHVALLLCARGDHDLIKELLDARLWETDGDDYLIHDYLIYNPSAKHLKQKRKEAKGRMKSLRKRSLDVRANISDVTQQEMPRGRVGSGTGSSSSRSSSGSEGGVGGGFECFWDAYPRKKGKETARAAWAKLAPDETLQAQMLAAIATQRTWPDWTKDGGAFIPHPTTWLNQKRWEDEATSVAVPLLSPVGQQNAAAADEWFRRTQAQRPAPKPTLARLT